METEHQTSPIFLVLFVIVAFAGLGYYWYGVYKESLSESFPTAIKYAATATPTAVSPKQPGETGERPSQEEMTREWRTYTNARLGFFLKLPPTITIADASTTTVVAFENETSDTVYIASREYPGKDGTRLSNSFAILRVGGRTGLYPNIAVWQIVVRSVRDQAALAEFVKERFGEGCELEDMELEKTDGMYDIEVRSSEAASGSQNSPCETDYRYVIKYDPAKGKAAAWDIGETPRFKLGEQALDPYMAESFTFL